MLWFGFIACSGSTKKRFYETDVFNNRSSILPVTRPVELCCWSYHLPILRWATDKRRSILWIPPEVSLQPAILSSPILYASRLPLSISLSRRKPHPNISGQMVRLYFIKPLDQNEVFLSGLWSIATLGFCSLLYHPYKLQPSQMRKPWKGTLELREESPLSIS